MALELGLGPEDRRATRRRGAGSAAARLRARWSGRAQPRIRHLLKPFGAAGPGPPVEPGQTRLRRAAPPPAWHHVLAEVAGGPHPREPLPLPPAGQLTPPTPRSRGRRAGRSRAPLSDGDAPVQRPGVPRRGQGALGRAPCSFGSDGTTASAQSPLSSGLGSPAPRPVSRGLTQDASSARTRLHL